MRLIGLAVVLTLSLLAAPIVAEAQSTVRARIAILETSAPDPARVAWWEAFRQRMRELGYFEGQNVTFEVRFADGRIERLPTLAAQFVKMKVDVIVTGGTMAAQAAKRATTSIPIVMATGADQVGLGIVASLARPGGNVTGVTSLTAELSGKRLGLLKDVVPGLSRVAFLLVEGDASSGAGLRDAQAAAGALNLFVSVFGVRRPFDFEKAFSDMARDRVEGVIIPSVAVYFAERKRLADLALKHHLPNIGGGKEHADAGLLMSYGVSYPEQFRRVAGYVDKILKGAKPADLPVEQPTKFELVINLKTAKALGLTIPQSILIRADQVIQ
jgi:putative tryptophan/tyrosine transport system substrate-binding protein